MTRFAALALALAACTDVDDIAPPTAGPVHRFVVDEITVPIVDHTQFAADLGGPDGTDAALNYLIVSRLDSIEALTASGNDQVRSGAIASSVEIIAANLDSADASVRFLGFDGADSAPVGGRFMQGVFASNRSETTAFPGSATLLLPIIKDTGPTTLRADLLEMELTPSPRGGYDLVIRGGVDLEEARLEAARRLHEMVYADPLDHILFRFFTDLDMDGVLTVEEIATYLEPTFAESDVAGHYLGFGFGMHLKPCSEGQCLEPAAPTCFDRVTNGAESGIDCGGSCLKCRDGETCATATDCLSGACTDGLCAVGTCDDGLINGFEPDVDCGPPCTLCELGDACVANPDCESGFCGIGPDEERECL
jgi:hypothetical protein